MMEEIRQTVEALAKVTAEQIHCGTHACPPPDRLEIVKVIHELQALLFPMAFRREYPDMADETLLSRALYRLRDQVAAAMRFQDLSEEAAQEGADRIVSGFAKRLPEIKRLLLLDVKPCMRATPPRAAGKRS